MMKGNDMYDTWYDYLLAHKEYWTHGMTTKRLEKVKSLVRQDQWIVNDLFIRHGAVYETPEQMKEKNEYQFNHGFGNFVCNIHYLMIKEKIIKG